jgi:hypothetical protein
MKRKTLQLNRETIRQLTPRELTRIGGGYADEPHDHTDNCSYTCPPPIPPPLTCGCTIYHAN